MELRYLLCRILQERSFGLAALRVRVRKNRGTHICFGAPAKSISETRQRSVQCSWMRSFTRENTQKKWFPFGRMKVEYRQANSIKLRRFRVICLLNEGPS